MIPRIATLLLAVFLAGCVDNPVVIRNNLDDPGPAALICLKSNEALPLSECAQTEQDYRLYLVQRFRSSLIAVDVDSRTMLDLDAFTPTPNGIKLPGQAVDICAAPSGRALYLVSSPEMLIRVDIPEHELTKTSLPFGARRIIASPTHCDTLDTCGAAGSGAALYLLSDGGDSILRWPLIDGIDLAEDYDILPSPSEALGDIAIQHGKLVGPSLDGRRLWMINVEGTTNEDPQEWVVIPLAPACSDGLDNDEDGQTDGQDWDCTSALGVSEDNTSTDFQCGNGVDDDEDGLTDMEDSGCARRADNNEGSDQSLCTDGIDNDGDGCTDPPDGENCSAGTEQSCEIADALQFETPTCADGIDNDGDGDTDADDEDCSEADSGEMPHAAPCGNGLDDNNNGLFDAPIDPNCTNLQSIAEHNALCSDGVDNDGDGATDTDDLQCYGPFGKRESQEPAQALSMVRIHPKNPIAYVLRAIQRDVLAVDLLEQRVISTHEDFPLWAHSQLADTPLPGLPSGMVFLEALTEVDDDGNEGELVLKAYVGTRNGLLSAYDPNSHSQTPLNDDLKAKVFQPSLSVQNESIDIRFALPEGVPHLGRFTVDEEKQNYYGITLRAEPKNIPGDIWTVTSGDILPDTESTTGRIVEVDRSFHDPGAHFCSAGVEPGDILEILPGTSLACGELKGSAFRINVTEVRGETLIFDPSTLTAELPDENGALQFQTSTASISPQCLAGPLHYRVRVAPNIFLVRGLHSGILHPWTEGANGCEKTTDDPLWTSRARVGTLKEDLEPESCPITTDDPAVNPEVFANPIFEFSLTPACELESFRPTYPETIEGVKYTFNTSPDTNQFTLLSASAGGTLVAPPTGGPIFFVDPSSESIFLLNPTTQKTLGTVN